MMAFMRRPLSFKFILLGVLCTLLYMTSWLFSSTGNLFTNIHRYPRCSAAAYSDGHWSWAPRTNKTVMIEKDEAMEFAGFAGCASSREFHWHLGTGDGQHERERFPNVNQWKWIPSSECNIRDLVREDLVRELVEEGGWLLLGDSITEGHFFSLSCLLSPHVRATPDYVKNPYFDRAWPQNLYLNPSSPLIPTLAFPPGFNISETPLVTFRRVDLLLEQSELSDLHRKVNNPSDEFALFSDEATWNLSPSYYLDQFTRPLPQANYGTMVVSTGGHWTTTLFSGFKDEAAAQSGYGINNVIALFKHAMHLWAKHVQDRLDIDEGYAKKGHIRGRGTRGKRRVVARAYLPGHEDCHNFKEPWTTVQPFVWNWYNWGNIWEFNQVFEQVLSAPEYPDIHYLAIDHPARLRPDAHVASDCLHIMAGAGVLEGWTHYIWHFISRELGYR